MKIPKILNFNLNLISIYNQYTQILQIIKICIRIYIVLMDYGNFDKHIA